MTTKQILLFASVAAAALATPGIAQSIDQRETRQEEQIREDEAAGLLTHSQAQQLRSAETHLIQTESRMRWQYGGDLSQLQRQTLQRMANEDSEAIFRMTGSTAHPIQRSLVDQNHRCRPEGWSSPCAARAPALVGLPFSAHSMPTATAEPRKGPAK